MKQDLEKAIKLVFGEEGGFTDNPKDRGNWTTGVIGKGELKGTKYGIAAHAYPHLDIKNLTLAQAATILDKEYWQRARCDELDSGLDLAVFDYAVNSGVGQAAKSLQKVLGVPQDGIIGPKTIKAANRQVTAVLIRNLSEERLAFMQRLSSWPTFKNGWTKRVNGIREAALNMTSSMPVALAGFEAPPLVDAEGATSARSVDTAVTSTKQGKVSMAAVAGAVVAGMPAVVTAMTPYADTPWVHTWLPTLAMIGSLGALLAGAVGFKLQSNRIANGVPQ